MAKTKNKKPNLADSFAKKRKQQMAKKTLSPFEVHVNRDKQKVLGRKSKADRGLPGIARAKAIAKRKNTLLQEYRNKDKDNVLFDRRIGEKQSNMSSEDKAMARFAAEKIKAHKKKNIYNLNDDEVLTHRGQSLMDIEKYDDPRSDDEDFDDNRNKSGKLANKFVENANFGGGLLSKPNSEMSRKDLIDQLIFESKKRKAERQKLKEQTVDLTEKLDTEWRDLLPLISSTNKQLEEVKVMPKTDEYDVVMKQLKFEARGKPSDKLKSEETIAREEKEKLEKLEQDRLARMQGFSEDTESKYKHRSADDLDDFHIEEIKETSDNEEMKSDILDGNDDEKEESFQGSENEVDESENENEDEESEDENEVKKSTNAIETDKKAENVIEENQADTEPVEDENSETEEESEDDLSDLKVSESESEEEIIPIKEQAKSVSSNKGSKPVKESSKLLKEQPQPLKEQPQLSNELTEQVKEPIELKIDEPADVIRNILSNGHYKIVEKNKEKVVNLFSHMLQYIDEQAAINSSEDVVKYFDIFSRLCPHLYDLAHLDPAGTKECMRDILSQKHTQFEKNIKVYPGLDTLSLFKLVSILYPTSDFRHPIVTPCLVFMSQILLRCKIKKKTDISKGLFVCSLVLEYTEMSKRWCPAAINFLRGVIYISLPKPFSKVIKVIPPFKSVGDSSNILVLEESHKKSDIEPVNIKMQSEDLFDEEIDDEYRIRAFVTATKLLNEFQKNCGELEAAFSIFKPIHNLFQCGSLKRFPKSVQELVGAYTNDLEQLKEKKLEPLAAAQKKPKALKLYEPRIEVVYEGRKHPRMPKEQVEISKLRNKIKKEKKSAIREIRKDNAFLSKVKIKQQIASDSERKRKVKEIFGDAAVQQHELKKFKKK